MTETQLEPPITLPPERKHPLARCEGECIRGPGALNSSGYCRTTRNGKRDYTHRVAYEDYYGPIPKGYEVDHLCFNRWCINPLHLEAVEQYENIRRQFLRLERKSHCTKGHERTPENVTSNGNCRICKLAYDKERWKRIKDRVNAKRRRTAS